MLLSLADESLGYGAEPILRHIHFTLSPGERVVLLGRSGAGKTTLLNRIYTGLSGQGARVALVPQDHGLVPQLSVFHNSYMGQLDRHNALYNLTNLVWPRAKERAQIAPILGELGLSGFARRPVGALSGGQRQRVALARAFHRGGSVMIADEPVSAVDEQQAIALMQSVAARFETTVIALHDVALARATATRLIGIKSGGFAFDAPPEAVTEAEIYALYQA